MEKTFLGQNFVFLRLRHQHPFLHKTKGPTRNPISPTPPPSFGGRPCHPPPPPLQSNFQAALGPKGVRANDNIHPHTIHPPLPFICPEPSAHPSLPSSLPASSVTYFASPPAPLSSLHCALLSTQTAQRSPANKPPLQTAVETGPKRATLSPIFLKAKGTCKGDKKDTSCALPVLHRTLGAGRAQMAKQPQ